MTTTQAIVEHLKSLPESARRQVLRFIEYLESRRSEQSARQDDLPWSEFSLAAAMRGMEDEDSPYSLSDLKEAFR